MLSLKAIETYYGTSQVLFGLSLDVQQGEVVTLLGRNGMGKTTTVHSIMGLTPIRAGVITLDGQAIHTLPPPYCPARAWPGARRPPDFSQSFRA